jgi:hypothetical protein
LKEIKRVQGVKGDPLKKNALDLVNAAEKIITRAMVLPIFRVTEFSKKVFPRRGRAA